MRRSYAATIHQIDSDLIRDSSLVDSYFLIAGRFPYACPAPAIRSSFIGRDDDLAALEQLVLEPGVRLVTVTGQEASAKRAW